MSFKLKGSEILKRDESVTDVVYYGIAEKGSLTSNAVWKIIRIDETIPDEITITKADGNDRYDNVWDDVLTLTYK